MGRKEGSGPKTPGYDSFSKGSTMLIDECDEQLIRRLIVKIMVYEDKFAIDFKSGVEV